MCSALLINRDAYLHHVTSQGAAGTGSLEARA
ncbi:hypothetical protein HaLaN_01629, partial [Haematococcus lacustris]